MHHQAHEWVAKHVPDYHFDSVLDLGGRELLAQGNVRSLFSQASIYVTLDIRPGEGVDIIADAAIWEPDREYDVVVCCETFEHTADWPNICLTAYDALCLGGLFIATMAGPGRGAHSAIDGLFRLHPGEYYGNVHPQELQAVLVECGFVDIVVDQQMHPADVRCIGRKK